MVGAGRVRGGQPPRLVAHHPRVGLGEGAAAGLGLVLQDVQPRLPVDGRGQGPDAGVVARGQHVLQRDAGDDGDVEQAARGGADHLGGVDVDGAGRQHHGVGACGVSGADHRAGVAGVTDLGQHEQGARVGAEDLLQGDVDHVRHGQDRLGGDGIGHHRHDLGGGGAHLHPCRRGGPGVGGVGVRTEVERVHHHPDPGGGVGGGGEELGHRAVALDQEPALGLTHRAPGEPGHRPHPLGAGVDELRRLRAPGGVAGTDGASAQAALSSPTGVPAGSAARAASTSTVKAAASLTAISASMRRSTSMPARPRPWMNRL